MSESKTKMKAWVVMMPEKWDGENPCSNKKECPLVSAFRTVKLKEGDVVGWSDFTRVLKSVNGKPVQAVMVYLP